MRFLFACGGTAGHVNPAIAIAGRIKELLPEAKILFVGAQGNMETELVPMAGYDLETVRITNLQRGFSMEKIAHNLRTAANVVVSRVQADKIIRNFNPSIVVGTGGYVCYPVISAAAARKIPTIIHDSNAVPGLTTKSLANAADRILVGFEESRMYYKHPERVTVTGTPVRMDFFKYSQSEAKKELGLPIETPLVVAVWGSLGAAKMNEIMVNLIDRAEKKPFFRLIYATGKRGFEAITERIGPARLEELKAAGFDIREYIYDMPLVMSASDLVMCRAGASTLAELTALGKPGILVPSPNVTNDHQGKNAGVLERRGAAVLVREEATSAENMLALVSELLNNQDRLSDMAEKMRLIGGRESTDKIVSIVLDAARKVEF